MKVTFSFSLISFTCPFPSHDHVVPPLTRSLRPVVMGGAKEMAAAFSMQGNSLPKGKGKGKTKGDNVPPPPRPASRNKQKKPVGITKQVQQKISVASAKLTELKVMVNKVNQSPSLLVFAK